MKTDKIIIITGITAVIGYFGYMFFIKKNKEVNSTEDNTTTPYSPSQSTTTSATTPVEAFSSPTTQTGTAPSLVSPSGTTSITTSPTNLEKAVVLAKEIGMLGRQLDIVTGLKTTTLNQKLIDQKKAEMKTLGYVYIYGSNGGFKAL